MDKTGFITRLTRRWRRRGFLRAPWVQTQVAWATWYSSIGTHDLDSLRTLFSASQMYYERSATGGHWTLTRRVDMRWSLPLVLGTMLYKLWLNSSTWRLVGFSVTLHVVKRGNSELVSILPL